MADPIGLSVRMRDYLNRTATHVVYLPDNTSYANAQTYATAYSLLLDLILGARVEALSLTFPGTLNAGIKAVPTAGQQIYTAGNATFNVAGSSRGHTIVLPGILESLLVGEDDIDTAAVAFTNWYATQTTGIDIGGGVFVQPTNRYNVDLTSFRAGSRAKRKF